MDGDLSNMVLLSPPVAFSVLFVLLFLGYRFIQKHTASGPDHPDKFLPYSGGQKIPPAEVRLSYKAFFRLGLLFGLVHVAVLVLATLPLVRGSLILGLFYLAGLSISAAVLALINKEKPKEK